ncbi:unnamed protein product [Euphydryas editha]|uniref:Uncharacterized protein n=1 Tax=Euphydryas editha TaxID=104508 RepID=A0AAU9TN36_EUPED|nr:unnamed protein product [Euphydryas editha]
MSTEDIMNQGADQTATKKNTKTTENIIVKKSKDSGKENEEEHCVCYYCGENYKEINKKPVDDWIQCDKSFAEVQAESNRLLIESLMASRTHGSVSPSSALSPVGTTTFAGNFSKCTSRFKRDRNDPEIVEAFVDAIETYKECTNISDIHALKGLPMLLEGEAAVWWRGVKASVPTWQDAIARLRAMFGVPRAPHKILRQIFSVEQGSERAEVFVARILALIAWLPYKIEERMQLDIVYVLLDRSIRKRLARNTLTSLDELVDKARAIEETLAEVDSSARKSAAPSSARAQSSTSAQQAHSSRSTRASSSYSARAPCPSSDGDASVVEYSAPAPPGCIVVGKKLTLHAIFYASNFHQTKFRHIAFRSLTLCVIRTLVLLFMSTQ